MGKFFDLDEVTKFFVDDNLKKEIKGIKSCAKAKEIIDNKLPDGKTASYSTVSAYMKLLKQTPLIKLTSNTIKASKKDKITDQPDKKTLAEEKEKSEILDNNFNIKVASVTSKKDETIGQLDNNPLDEDEEHSSSIFDINIDNKEDPDDTSKQDEKIVAQSSGERNVTYIGQNTLKEIDDLKEHNNNLLKDNNSLKNQNEEFKQKLTSSKEIKEIKDNPMFQITSLNELLSTNEQITVSINKELLIKITKFVDEHHLIRLEPLIREEGSSNLNSKIVQSILLAFMNQNSLF